MDRRQKAWNTDETRQTRGEQGRHDTRTRGDKRHQDKKRQGKRGPGKMRHGVKVTLLDATSSQKEKKKRRQSRPDNMKREHKGRREETRGDKTRG